MAIETIKKLLLHDKDKPKSELATGKQGQISACFSHYVSKSRLRELKDSKVRIMVMTGTWDHVRLISQSNDYQACKNK